LPDYRYELRRGEEIVATGHLSREEALAVGEPFAIGGRSGIVKSAEPLFGRHELRLVVELTAEAIDDGAATNSDK